MGKLEEKRFEMLSAEYEKEQDELEQTLASDQASLDQFNEDTTAPTSSWPWRKSTRIFPS